ncbi:MAG: rRNA biogenesis protein rrp36 [Peltula sp. TS41687]|nr:MAG: rRNA biogenesis protein rrp36 [Peltula sp. TS41687]
MPEAFTYYDMRRMIAAQIPPGDYLLELHPQSGRTTGATPESSSLKGKAKMAARKKNPGDFIPVPEVTYPDLAVLPKDIREGRASFPLSGPEVQSYGKALGMIWVIMKRKVSVASSLQRRVRPRRDDDHSDISATTSSEGPGSGSGSASQVEDNLSSDDESTTDVEESAPSPSGADFTSHLGSLSFGALAAAQESLATPSHRAAGPTTTAAPTSTKLASLRQRLQELKHAKASTSASSLKPSAAEDPSKKLGRANKHAPTELSSKKAVSRKREVLAVQPRAVRDPRFEALSGPAVDEERWRKNYAFLTAYRDDEIKELRARVKKTKDVDVKGELKRELVAMESRKKSQEMKDQRRDILKDHRAEERRLVKQGKKPYYLKKAEQKRRLLVERYANLKGKQVDRAIERKREKNVARERRAMPRSRREVVDG